MPSSAGRPNDCQSGASKCVADICMRGVGQTTYFRMPSPPTAEHPSKQVSAWRAARRLVGQDIGDRAHERHGNERRRRTEGMARAEAHQMRRFLLDGSGGSNASGATDPARDWPARAAIRGSGVHVASTRRASAAARSSPAGGRPSPARGSGALPTPGLAGGSSPRPPGGGPQRPISFSRVGAPLRAAPMLDSMRTPPPLRHGRLR